MGLFSKNPLTAPTPDPIIAAAEEIHLADSEKAQEVWLSKQPWQERVYGFYNDVGEVRFSTKFVGNALSKIRLVAAEWEGTYAEENEAPVKTTNDAVTKAVSQLRSKRGGQGGLLRSLSQNLFLVGESWLVGSGTGDSQTWDALSISELQIRPNEKKAYRKTLPALPPKPLSEQDLLVRVWQEHPQYSELADSGFRTVLGECEKLLLLSRADRAAARSRFAGRGLLFLPNELVPPSQQPNARSGQNTGPTAQHPVLETLTKGMIEPIKDETHPSSVVPVVLVGPGEQGNNIKYFSFEAAADKQAAAKREEARASIAVAIDLPADVLTGKGDLSHWNAWLIREETFQQHLQPFVELICSALTIGYLHPALQRAGVEDYEKYVIWFDDSRLVARPNRTEGADVGLNVPGALSHAAWRRERGFSEDDAPSDEEYAKQVGVALGDPKMAVTGEVPPEDPLKLGGQGQPKSAPPSNPPATNPQGQIPKEVHPRGTNNNTPNPAKTAQPGSSKKAPVTASASRSSGAKAGRQLAQIDVNLMQKIRIAAGEITLQALNRAGARVRSKVKDKSTYHELLADIPNLHVAKTLGPATLASLELAPAELTKDAFAGFATKVDAWIRQAQRQRNYTIAGYAATLPTVTDKELSDQERRDQIDGQLENEYGPRDHDNRGLAVSLLIAGLTAFAAEQLFATGEPGPSVGEFDSLEVPASLVRDAVETAGGGSGIGTGGVADEILTDLGIPTDGQEWVYGAWERSRAFPAHEDLDGVEFSSPTDDVLAVSPEDDWLGREYYWVGDHRGCLCQVAPLLGEPEAEGDNG